MKIKDLSYPGKRDVLRKYDGTALSYIKMIRLSAVGHVKNFIKAAKIMSDLGYEDERITNILEKTAADGYCAFEIIRDKDGKIIGLSELEAATLSPYISGDVFLWKQFINGDWVTFGKDDIIYLAMPELFEKQVSIIDTETTWKTELGIS